MIKVIINMNLYSHLGHYESCLTYTGCLRISCTIWNSYKLSNVWPTLVNCDSNKKENSLIFPRKNFGRKTCLSLNYDVTKLHHISLVALNFIHDESVKRWGIFRFKNVFSNTDSIYGCTNYEIRIPWEKQLNKQHILDIVNRFEKMRSVQWLLWEILLIQLTLSLIKRTSVWRALLFVVFCKTMLNLSKTYECSWNLLSEILHHIQLWKCLSFFCKINSIKSY